MTKPATDSEIAFYSMAHDGMIARPGIILSLIARIHKEQEDRKTVEDLASSIRFCTIQECAEIARGFQLNIFGDGLARMPLVQQRITTAEDIERDILALLEVRK